MSGWSNITFSQDIYRWLLSLDILQNKGQINQKGSVLIPQQDGFNFQNGFNIAQMIQIILQKNGQLISQNLKNIVPQNSKQAKSTNWNFIWLSFDELRMQFDNRIKQLILNGQTALISEIVKQLFQRDDTKNDKQMKQFLIKQKVQQKKLTKQTPMNNSKRDSSTKGKQKQQPTQSNGALDIKKVNLSKNPDESESSLQFLILLLTQSLQMSVEQVLGLFTNQNKYLAHLIVKGVNDQFEGVILFYTMLNKYYKKLKSFIDSDPKDAHSCLYAVKPGFISKNQKVAESTIELFLKVGNIHEWFISQAGKGSTTLFLGIKRHPHLLDLYFNLLMEIIQNQEAQFFTRQFKQCFKDSYQMIETCYYIIPSLANSFFKDKLHQLGILNEWIQIGMKLFTQNLDSKVITYKFIGSIMSFIPDVVQNNQQYLLIFKNGWKQRSMIDFIYLTNQMISIFQQLTEKKNYLAKTLYQIFIEIIDVVYSQLDKKDYILAQFAEILPDFPSIPTNFMVQVFKQPKLKNYQVTLINHTVKLSNDPNCLIKIAGQCLKYFTQDSLTQFHLANTIYQICRKTIDSEQGKTLILKVIKNCLQAYSLHQISKKGRVVKQQPLYGINKVHAPKVTKEQQNQFIGKQQMQKNWISLVQKLCELVTQSINEDLQKSIKQQLLQKNSFIKKNNYKLGGRAISSILNKKFGVSKQQQVDHAEDYINRKSISMMQQSSINKKNMVNPLSASRYAGPPTLRKQFAEVNQKRKRQQEQKRFQDQRKIKEEAYKKTLVKKQLDKINLLRGFAQEAEIKEDGFWEKFRKDQNKELELYPPELMEPKDIEVIQNLFKKYHRVLRYLFLKYTSSMYSTKQSQNFEQNKERKQTISVVQLIKFLKQYKMYFLTTNIQIQNLVRDVNVKLLNKRQTQQLDFMGFEQFIIQFCSIIFTKPHTITAKSSQGQQNIKKKLIHLSHSEIISDWFEYLRTVFIQKGEKTSIFDQPEAAYFNETQVIRQFNRKIQQDPGFLLPEGYKKVYDRIILPQAKISQNISKVTDNYIDVIEVLDSIIYQSELGFHILESILKKQTKVRVKPHAFINVKAKLLDSTDKPRALSSIIQKKTAVIPPVKMLQKKTLSFGMRMGLSYVGYKDKLLGEQVAYVIDDILDAVQKGRNTIEKQKIVNEIVRGRMDKQESMRKQQQDRKRKLKQRKSQLQKILKQTQEKRTKQKQQSKQQKQKQQTKKQQRQKKLKEKYLEEQKQKIKDKKVKQQQEAKKKVQQKSKNKQSKIKNKQKFQDFNKKQIQKFKSKLDGQSEKRKKQDELSKEDAKKKEEMYKKLRQKISQKDKKAIQVQLKTNQQIIQLYNSDPIKQVFRQFQASTKSLFEFLIQNTYISLTQKKLKNEVILQTWHYFNLTFQLSPLIISAKDLFSIFRQLTKDKQISSEYHTGLSYEEFKQALIRVAIKHKTVFNKISQKIKQDDMTDKQINDVINKDIEQKQRNEFDQPKPIDVKSLLKEDDVKKQYFNHYGDVSKVNETTLKGLIYYLRVPRDKQGQDQRWREIIASKIKYSSKQTQQLKQKLNEEYSLKKEQRQRQKQRIRKRLASSNQSTLNNSMMKQSKLNNLQPLNEQEQTQNKEP